MKAVSQILTISLLLNWGVLWLAQGVAQTEIDPKILSKIMFDFSSLSTEGLVGQPHRLRSLSYEFCIPNRQETIEAVSRIDQQIQFFLKSPGRIGCQKNEILCLNDTHKPQWREILIKLALLDYIKSIQEYYGE